jgi:hypothetical protein
VIKGESDYWRMSVCAIVGFGACSAVVRLIGIILVEAAHNEASIFSLAFLAQLFRHK